MALPGGGRIQLEDPEGWAGWVTPEGFVKLQTPHGQIIKFKGYVKPGYSPVKGKDYKDGDPGKDGVGLRRIAFSEHSDGVVISTILTDGRAFNSPVILHGEAGPGPSNSQVAAGILAYLKVHPITVPKDGEPGKDGDDGRPPSHIEVVRAVEDFLERHPIPVPKDGKPGEDGDDGEMGPMPAHELDPPESPSRIRFQQPRGRWGAWIDMRRLLPRFIGGGGAAGGSNQQSAAGAVWGAITGLLSSQPDLQAALNAASLPSIYTPVVKDLGVARNSGSFDITGLSGLTPDKLVSIVQTAAPVASKGNARDEAEMDAVVVTGYVLDANTIRAYWRAPSVVVGDVAFAYAVTG